MADINTDALSGLVAPAEPAARQMLASSGAPLPATDPGLLTVIELLFFAYRDFTRDADAILSTLALGRAHHRVLHFVDRHPGLRVADLLEILKITKQSLAPVLKQLVDEGWIAQEADIEDRRVRRLHATQKGANLARRLDSVQARRVKAALAACAAGQESAVRHFLLAMINDNERAGVEALLPEPTVIDR
ncbi:MAG TPA: MarR family transcriptional regulator [Hyphomicrobiaceae bacterium]|nr:MarR family transcriptional regulator [Hyphomicrobiaceae bacterium]